MHTMSLSGPQGRARPLAVDAERLLPILVVVTWAALYLPRLFLLGLYHDDWYVLAMAARDTAPFSWSRFVAIFAIFANRPVLAFATYVFSSLCGASPVLWQSTAAGLTLACALALASLVRKVFLVLNLQPPWAGYFASLMWLVFPWNLGFTAWPTLALCMIAIILFALGSAMLLQYFVGSNARSLVCAGAVLLFGFLTYEAFYGQWIFVIGLGVLLWINKQTSLGSLIVATLGVVVLQALALAANRWLGMLTAGSVVKTLNPSLVHLGVQNLDYVFTMSGSFLPPAVLPSFVIAAALVIRFSLKTPEGRRVMLTAAIAASLMAVCIVLSSFLYASAGYGLTSTGLESRTTMSACVWLACLVPLLVAVWVRTPKALQVLIYVLLGIGMSYRAYWNLQLMGHWAGSWRLQQSVLANVPVADLRRSSPGSVVLFCGPQTFEGVTVFESTWDLNSAVHFRYPEFDSRFFYPARSDWVTKWDGTYLETRASAGRVYEKHANEVWVWNNDLRRAERAKPGLRIPPEASK